MQPEHQRIIIAEFCGFYDIEEFFPGGELKSLRGRLKDGVEHPFNWEPWHGLNLYSVPDYPSDLNAMHEAEKKLDISQKMKYWVELKKICRVDNETLNDCPWRMLHSPAERRSEAFIRTIGKWEE